MICTNILPISEYSLITHLITIRLQIYRMLSLKFSQYPDWATHCICLCYKVYASFQSDFFVRDRIDRSVVPFEGSAAECRTVSIHCRPENISVVICVSSSCYIAVSYFHAHKTAIFRTLVVMYPASRHSHTICSYTHDQVSDTIITASAAPVYLSSAHLKRTSTTVGHCRTPITAASVYGPAFYIQRSI